MLGDDLDPELGLDAGHDMDPDLVLANGLDRLAQVDVVAVDLDPLLPQPIRDVAGRDRAEQPVAFAGLDADLDGQRIQALGEGLGIRPQRAIALVPLVTVALPVADRAEVRQDRGPGRDQVVAGVSVLDVAGGRLRGRGPSRRA